MEDKEQRNVTITPSNIIFATMIHIAALSFALFLIWQAKPGTSLFSWHPTLMVLGCGFFMLQAILMFSKSSSLIASSTRATKVKYHWILQTIAALTTVAGFLVIFINKNIHEKQHFKSWHGTIGGLTVLAIVIQSLMGIQLLYTNLPVFNKVKLAIRKQLHALSGTLIFIVSCLVLFLGLYSNWFTRKVELYSWVWCISAFCPILFAATVNNQIAQVYLFKKA